MLLVQTSECTTAVYGVSDSNCALRRLSLHTFKCANRRQRKLSSNSSIRLMRLQIAYKAEYTEYNLASHHN